MLVECGRSVPSGSRVAVKNGVKMQNRRLGRKKGKKAMVVE